MIYIKKELREIPSENDLRITYMSLIESITSYGIIAWEGSFENVLSCLLITKIHFYELLLRKSQGIQRKICTQNLMS